MLGQGWIKICKVGRVKGREGKNMRWEGKGMQHGWHIAFNVLAAMDMCSRCGPGGQGVLDIEEHRRNA